MQNSVVYTLLLASVVIPGQGLSPAWESRMREANELQAARKLDQAAEAYRALLLESDRFPPSDWRRAQILNNYAAHLADRGDHTAASEHYQRAIAIFRMTAPNENLGVAQCNLGVLYRGMGQYDQAISSSLEGIRTLEQIKPEGSGFLATCYNNVAESQRNVGAFEAAEQAARTSIDIAGRVLPAGDIRLGNALHTLGNVLHTSGRSAEALPVFDRALAIRKAAVGPAHPFVGMTLASKASALLTERRAGEAETLAARAVEVLEGAHGPEHGILVGALNNYAQALRVQKRYDAAEPLLRRALAISAKWNGIGHPDHARIVANLGDYLYEVGRLQAAGELYRSAASTLLATLGPDNPTVAAVHISLAHVYRDLRRRTESESLYRTWRRGNDQVNGEIRRGLVAH